MHHPRQVSTYHSLCYPSRGALASTRNSSMGPPGGIDPTTHCIMSERFNHEATSRSHAKGIVWTMCLPNPLSLLECRVSEWLWSLTSLRESFTYLRRHRIQRCGVDQHDAWSRLAECIPLGQLIMAAIGLSWTACTFRDETASNPLEGRRSSRLMSRVPTWSVGRWNDCSPVSCWYSQIKGCMYTGGTRFRGPEMEKR